MTDGQATEGYSSQGAGGSNSGEDDELYAIHLENRSDHSFPCNPACHLIHANCVDTNVGI